MELSKLFSHNDEPSKCSLTKLKYVECRRVFKERAKTLWRKRVEWSWEDFAKHAYKYTFSERL